MSQTHIWLRAETKPQEQRTALTPSGAKTLIESGFKVSVERSEQNIFDPEKYRKVGCDIVAQGSWPQAPNSAFILGLKELPEDNFPLVHKHIYFAHAYKEQTGASDILSRFKQGDGALYDLEFLVDENQCRIAAFGYWAGFAGAALGIWTWANKQLGKTALSPVSSFPDQAQLIREVSILLAQCATKPTMMVIGAKGRSGSGAIGLAKALQINTIEWDMEETMVGGPFAQVNNADVLVNCVLVNRDLPPFVTYTSLDTAERTLSVICDVSCDPYGDYNPIRIYDHCTTFNEPTIEVIPQPNNLHLIAIDHLPSLLPKESSEDFGQQLVPYLARLDDLSRPVWQQALDIYHQKTKNL